MAGFYVITTLVLLTLVLTSRPASGQVWKKDIKVKYFSSVILTCRPDNDNHTQTLPAGTPTPTLVFWITPDAAVLSEVTPAGDFPANVLPVVQGGFLTMLNLTEVSDDAFGYYTCVTVMPVNQVRLVRWGLNVDGADFSELEEEYRKNAIVGAIAAAVMIVLVGGACLIWHFRHSKRHARGLRGEGASDADDEEEDLKKKKSSASVYHNQGYDDQLPPAEAAEKASGGKSDNSAVTEAGSEEGGGSVSRRM